MASKRTQQTQTQDGYRKCSRAHIRQFKQDKGKDFLSHSAQFVQWMIDRKSTVKTSTWRYYKAAVSFDLAENGYDELAEQLKKESNKGTLDSIQNRADTVLRTSSLKQKYITEQQEEKILTLLKAQKKDGHFWAGPLQTFIKAGLLVGLRPSEWPNSAMLY